MPGIVVPPALPGPSLSADQTWTGADVFNGSLRFANATQRDVKVDYGAKGDVKTVTDGAMTNASPTLTSATAAFTAADVGKQCQVMSAQSTAMRLATTIVSVTNGTTIVVARAPTLTTTAQTLTIDGLRTVADAATTANSTSVTSASAAFTAADVGKSITITNAAAIALNTTISGYTNATTVTLAANATRTCSGVQVLYGTDDTAAFNSACVYARDNPKTTIYFPEATYFCQSSVSGVGGVVIYGNTTFRGDGWGTIIRGIGKDSGASSTGELFGINPWAGGSSDVTLNTRNIVFENLHFQGNTVEDGFYQWRLLISMASASDVTIRSCKFSNWQGDAVYVGMGTQLATLERHNERVKILNCTFDGINRNNRNAISVLDCDDLLVDGNSFLNCTRQDMPGCVDVEPNTNNLKPVLRGLRFTNNYGWFCGGNSGHIGMFLNVSQLRLTTPQRTLLIKDNTFLNGVGGQLAFYINQQQYPTESTPRNDVVVEGNFIHGGYYSIEVEGMKGLIFKGNTFRDMLYSAIFGYAFKNLDCEVQDNKFISCGGTGSYAIELSQADRTVIDRNVFENCGASDLSQGFILRLANGGSLSVPAAPTLATATTGGTLAAATYSYRVTSLRDNGTETTVSVAATQVTTGTTSTVTVTWAEDYGAAQYRVYGRTGGSELLMQTLPAGTLSWIDTGSVTPSGAQPGANTTGNGNTNGIRFTNNLVRQGASNRTTQMVNAAAGHTTVANSNVHKDNLAPGLSLAIAPFVDSTNTYTVAAASLTVDASTVPDNGVIVINTSATANTTLTVSNPTKGQIVTFDWVITSTSQAYAFAANMKFNAATAPTQSTVTGRHDTVIFRYDGTNWLELARAINVG